MSLLRWLGGKQESLPEEAQRDLLRSLFHEAATLLPQKPKKAVSILRSRAKPAYELIRIGGPMHRDFRDLVEKAWVLMGPCELVPSDAVEVICWDTWKDPRIWDLSECADASRADFLYLTPPDKRNPKDALAELEALCLLVSPKMAMVVLGEDPSRPCGSLGQTRWNQQERSPQNH